MEPHESADQRAQARLFVTHTVLEEEQDVASPAGQRLSDEAQSGAPESDAGRYQEECLSQPRVADLLGSRGEISAANTRLHGVSEY
jgi:hypothetical protein